MNTAGVSVKNLKKQYSIGTETIDALKNINLFIPEGSFTTIVGKSGCGKTTLLRLLSELEKPSGGKIEFVFDSIGEGSKHKQVGLVFQESRLMPWLTVKENMAFPLFKMKDKEETEKIVEKYLTIMGLEKFRNAYPSQISGGMARRTAIGRVLCHNPDIILMDEPFASLDYFTRNSLQEEMVKLFVSQRKTIVFVTHNVEEAIALGQRIIVLNDGEIVLERPVSLPYPRKFTDPIFQQIRAELLDAITNTNNKPKIA